MSDNRIKLQDFDSSSSQDQAQPSASNSKAVVKGVMTTILTLAGLGVGGYLLLLFLNS